MMGLFETYGIPVNPQDMRALTGAEISKMQVEQENMMRQAVFAPYQAAAMRNMWNMIREERSIDERFADFKERLAASIHRMEQAKLTGTANQVHMDTIK